jgi:hypothetical protein
MNPEPVDLDPADRDELVHLVRLRLFAARLRGDLVRFGWPRHVVVRLTLDELLELRDKAVAHLMDAPRSGKED